MSTSVVRRIARWTTRLALLAVLGLVAFAIAVLVVLPRATHGAAMTVLSGSMSPGIPVGSVVVDRPVDPGTLHVGDIATYQKSPGKAEFITHRIVKIDTSKSPAVFTFKGDANRGADIDPVPASAIRGKVWFHVPYLGAIRDAIHTKGGLAALGMLGLAGYALYQFGSALRDRRRRAALPADIPVDTPTDRPVTEAPTDRRTLILATLRVGEFDGMSARAVSRLLNGLLLDVSGPTFTVLVSEPPARAEETIALLRRFHPVTLQTTASANRPTGSSPSLEPRAAVPELTGV